MTSKKSLLEMNLRITETEKPLRLIADGKLFRSVNGTVIYQRLFRRGVKKRGKIIACDISTRFIHAFSANEIKVEVVTPITEAADLHIPHIMSIDTVFFNDLEHQALFDDGFSSVSYGDAEYTLVRAELLISELENRESFRDSEDPSLEPLISELRRVPKGILVALSG